MEVRFYEKVDDNLLKFAAIVSKAKNKWLFCKHKQRDTYEVPGGHREPNEDILATATRELFEETGATDFSLTPICVYSVAEDNDIGKGIETFGMLYFADINVFGNLPNFEMEKIVLFDELPTKWTYPKIQPKLIEKVLSMLE
jgi:8-oxo-dGTP diphosphatase